MKLIKIDLNNKSQKEKFKRFPNHIYQNNPFWVPPLESEIHLTMNPSKHPFYKHSNADFFMVESEGDILGRIAVLQNRNFNDFHHSKTAFFYYFDSINDYEVAKILFTAALDGAKGEGLGQILGPKGFLRSSGVGLLIEGFEYPPAMGQAFNFPYYRSLLEQMNFVKETDFLSGYLDYSHIIPEKIHEAAEKIKNRGNFWVQGLSLQKDNRGLIHSIEEIHSKAFETNPNYIPSTDEEFKLMATSILQIAEPGLIKFIMKGKDVAGFILAYPNVNRAIREINGRLWPFGWIKVLIEKKKTRLCDLNGLGIAPEYQGVGANILIYHELEQTLRNSQFEKVELVQVDERNLNSMSDMEKLGVSWQKRHRVYKLDVLNS